MTQSRDLRVVIDEMIDHIEYVLAKTRNKSAAEFRHDRDIRQSVERSLEIISEASRHLSAELKKTKPKIPWRQVADFGNVLRHTYFSVDSDVVWKIAKEHLQPLRAALEDLRRQIRA
jgi:uncharacterized protein with HEPN domain